MKVQIRIGLVNLAAAEASNVYSSIAQLVERLAVNQNVVGSSPTGGAMGVPLIAIPNQKSYTCNGTQA